MSLDRSPHGLAIQFAEIERQLVKHGRVDDAMTALTHTSVDTVAGAQFAGVTLSRGSAPLATVAPTDELVDRIDRIQYDLESGPCVQAVTVGGVVRVEDLRTDDRFPGFGPRAAELDVLSMMSFPLFLPEDTVDRAGLNLYSTEVGAFDDEAETIGMLLATHGALALAGTLASERADNLQKALASNREIGVAMGILMSQYRLDRQQAFDVLRITSQETHRKIAVIASEVADTGKLELPARLRNDERLA